MGASGRLSTSFLRFYLYTDGVKHLSVFSNFFTFIAQFPVLPLLVAPEILLDLARHVHLAKHLGKIEIEHLEFQLYKCYS